MADEFKLASSRAKEQRNCQWKQVEWRRSTNTYQNWMKSEVLSSMAVASQTKLNCLILHVVFAEFNFNALRLRSYTYPFSFGRKIEKLFRFKSFSLNFGNQIACLLSIFFNDYGNAIYFSNKSIVQSDFGYKKTNEVDQGISRNVLCVNHELLIFQYFHCARIGVVWWVTSEDRILNINYL